jgi:hypothetical protein
MPQPTQGDVHVDVALSQISIAFKNADYIGDRVSPKVPVGKQSDKYFIWTKDFWFRNYVQKRTPSDTYPEAGLELSTDSYFADIFHLAFPLPDEVMNNQDAAVDLPMTGSTWLADQFMLNREIAVRDDLFKTGVWDTDVVGGTNFTQWNNLESSDPPADILTGQQVMQKSTGIRPKQAVMGQEVWDTIRYHPLLLEKIKYTQGAKASEAQVAEWLDLDELIIGGAIGNTAQEGATFSGGYIWGDDVLLQHVAASPGLMTPSASYTFIWDIDGGGLPIQVSRIREDSRDRDLLKAKHAFDNKVVSTALGYFLDNCLA